MSRVYRALEKAEREKQEKSRKESVFGIPEQKSVSGKKESALRLSHERAVEVGLPSREETPVLVAAPNSFAEEQFRKLKTQILHWSSNPPHIILVSSAVPGEGKTMVAVNLAMSISQELQKKVILIDGDLRKPEIHLETQQRSKGLSNYLSDQTPLLEILFNSETENLRIIPAGPSSERSPELIGSRRMGELLTSLREFGDDTYVIIDSSPILSTSEPILLSKLVESVVLVVMADQTPRESVKRAIESIGRQKIIGVVLNQIELKPSSYYSKHYYKYYRK
jgi:protein-tyrosine kinase